MTIFYGANAAGVTINGSDLGVVGAALATGAVEITVRELAGWWDGLAISPTWIDAGTSRLGPALAASVGTASAREGTITLNIHAETPATLRAALQALAALVPPGAQVDVALDTAGDRVWRCVRTRWGAAYQGNSPHLDTWAVLTLAFTAAPPMARSAAPRVVAVASADATGSVLPLGTLPVFPRVRITPGATGSAVNPALVLTDSTGAEVGRLTLTTTLSAGAWLDVDMGAATITTSAGANANALRTGGEYFALDPADGDPARGEGPALQLTVASGSARALLIYPLLWDA